MAAAVAEVVRAEVRGRFGQALREHYLAGISCDRARHEDNPVCACSRVFLGWHPSVGEAVEAWIAHVMDVAGSEEAGAEPAPDLPVAADLDPPMPGQLAFDGTEPA